MKFRLSFHITTTCIFILISVKAFAQPAITFSEPGQFRGKPHIIGKTDNRYFCLYGDSLSSLVIYDHDMKEKSRLNWDSIVSEKQIISYQVFTLKDKLSILLKEKTANGQQLKAIDISETGVFISENILFTDTTEGSMQAKNYEAEISKNGKYILLYRGIKLDEEHMLFDGALFDNNWTLMKSFNYPLDKNSAEDSWYGAMVDIEGNIHTLLFTAYDNWRLGTKIRVHTIAMQTDEMKIEQMEVRRKRLVNYSLREDTSTHSIQLQAIVVQQHSKDPLSGIGFVSFPYKRNGRIIYSAYELTSEQKRDVAKGLLPVKHLIDNSDIDYPSSFSEGGAFFTCFVLAKEKRINSFEEAKKDPFNQPRDLLATTNLPYIYDPLRPQPHYAYGGVPFADGGMASYNLMQERNKNLFNMSDKNFIRLMVVKNSPDGKLELFAKKEIKKGSVYFYDQNFTTVKGDSLYMLTYMLEEKGPVLYLITDAKDLTTNKVKVPNNNFLFLQDARAISNDECIAPYMQQQTGSYGLAKIVF